MLKRFIILGLLALMPTAALADLLTFTAPNGSWAAAQASGITGGARSIRISNPLAVPIQVRYGADADTGAAQVRVEAGDVLRVNFTDNGRPAELAVYGVGGTGSVYIETSAAGDAYVTSDRVSVGLSSATPLVAGAAAAGTSVLASKADHVHPPQGPGTVTQTSIGSETSNTRRVTWTLTDAAGATVNAGVCHLQVFTASMAPVDGSTDGAFTLITGTALTPDFAASNIEMWVTASSAGVVAADIIDKSGSLTGDLIAVATCSGIGVKVSTVSFT